MVSRFHGNDKGEKPGMVTGEGGPNIRSPLSSSGPAGDSGDRSPCNPMENKHIIQQLYIV